MILEIVAAVALGGLSMAGIGFLVAHALSDYKSKSEVTQRILEKYMVDNRLKTIEQPQPAAKPVNPNQPR